MSSVIATIGVGTYPDAVGIGNRNRLIDGVTGGLVHRSHAYVANNEGDSVSVIRLSTNTVWTTIPGIEAPSDVAVSANGAHAYVLRWQGVSVIDTATHAIVDSIAFGAGSASCLAVSPDESRLYVESAGITVLDTVTHAVTATIETGPATSAVAFSADGSRVYVANVYDDTVAVVDVSTEAVIATTSVGDAPVAVAVSPDSRTVYVANAAYTSATGTISVIDASTQTVTATIPVGAAPNAVGVSPDGSRVFVVNYADGVDVVDGKVVRERGGTVSIIDASTNAVVETVTVGRWPRDLDVSRDGRHVYVTNAGDGTVSVIEVENDLSKALKTKIADLLGAADRDGGGWIIIGGQVIPVPPRSPALAAVARIAALRSDTAVDAHDVVERLRRATRSAP